MPHWPARCSLTPTGSGWPPSPGRGHCPTTTKPSWRRRCASYGDGMPTAPTPEQPPGPTVHHPRATRRPRGHRRDRRLCRRTPSGEPWIPTSRGPEPCPPAPSAAPHNCFRRVRHPAVPSLLLLKFSSVAFDLLDGRRSICGWIPQGTHPVPGPGRSGVTPHSSQGQELAPASARRGHLGPAIRARLRLGHRLGLGAAA